MIARETIDEVRGEAGADVSPTAEPAAAGPRWQGHLPVIGVLAVPPWRADPEASVLLQAYRDLVELPRMPGAAAGGADRRSSGAAHGQGEGGNPAVIRRCHQDEQDRKKSPMEPYVLIPGAGPFAASANLFTTLVAELEGPGAPTDRVQRQRIWGRAG